MSGIFSISRFRMATDGPGISTLIGFSGCPLNCQYCPNPICHADRSHWPDYSARELIDFVRRDELYMRMTGGGISSVVVSRWAKSISSKNVLCIVKKHCQTFLSASRHHCRRP